MTILDPPLVMLLLLLHRLPVPDRTMVVGKGKSINMTLGPERGEEARMSILSEPEPKTVPPARPQRARLNPASSSSALWPLPPWLREPS